MINEQFSSWLYTNAPAAWISAVVATATLIFVLFTRKRPRRLVVREITSNSLVNIQNHVKRRIRVLFDGNPVKDLSQLDLDLFNQGSEPIVQAIIRISLPSGSKILHAEVNPPLDSGSVELSDSTVVIRLPHINPHRDHAENRRISILADGKAEPISVSGSGEGWSVKHLPLPTKRQVLVGLVIIVACFVILAGLAVAYIAFAESAFGITRNEMSVRALVASLPFIALFGLFMLIVNRWVDRALRLRQPQATDQKAALRGDA